MKDPWNPTDYEIRAWAYDAEELEPEQDWSLALADFENGPLLLELASDEQCPKRSYFLNCLYLLAGEHFRSKNFRSRQFRRGAARLAELIDRTAGHDPEWIQRWAERTRTLIENPKVIDYAAWCEGGLAYGDPSFR